MRMPNRFGNMKNKLIIFSVLAFLVIVLFFLNSSANVQNLNADEVEQLINDENTFILQVHEPYQGEIPNTDLIIEDWENIENYLDLLSDKNSKILVYCRSGRMSSIVAEKLLSLGYENIYNFEEGMKAWETSGRKLIFN